MTPVALARAPARLVVLAVAEERGDHAVLHVKERHRVVDDDLGEGAERRREERRELGAVEIERGREGDEPSRKNGRRSELVRHVERKVADARD